MNGPTDERKDVDWEIICWFELGVVVACWRIIMTSTKFGLELVHCLPCWVNNKVGVNMQVDELVGCILGGRIPMSWLQVSHHDICMHPKSYLVQSPVFERSEHDLCVLQLHFRTLSQIRLSSTTPQHSSKPQIWSKVWLYNNGTNTLTWKKRFLPSYLKSGPSLPAG